MNRRGIREGLVGLLVVVGLGIFVGLYLWISGGINQGGYRFTISLSDANGLSIGAPVRLRGVRIGQVEKLIPRVSNVEIVAMIDRPDILIPKNSEFAVAQSGLIGETFIEIFPDAQASIPRNVEQKSIEAACKNDPSSLNIVCPGGVVVGNAPIRFQELVRSLDSLASRLDARFFNNLQTTLVKFGRTADEVGFLARKAANTADALTTTVVGTGKEVRSLGSAARALEKTANDLDSLLASDRSSINQTVANLNATTGNFRKVSEQLESSITRESLQKIVANTDATVANLKALSVAVADPGTIASLRETLDSARATLTTVNKITSDVEELTGDPKFRTNLRKLVDGLGGLVSAEPGSNLTRPALFGGSVGIDATLTAATHRP